MAIKPLEPNAIARADINPNNRLLSNVNRGFPIAIASAANAINPLPAVIFDAKKETYPIDKNIPPTEAKTPLSTIAINL